jgi:hypothetical protein
MSTLFCSCLTLHHWANRIRTPSAATVVPWRIKLCCRHPSRPWASAKHHLKSRSRTLSELRRPSSSLARSPSRRLPLSIYRQRVLVRANMSVLQGGASLARARMKTRLPTPSRTSSSETSSPSSSNGTARKP